MKKGQCKLAKVSSERSCQTYLPFAHWSHHIFYSKCSCWRVCEQTALWFLSTAMFAFHLALSWIPYFQSNCALLPAILLTLTTHIKSRSFIPTSLWLMGLGLAESILQRKRYKQLLTQSLGWLHFPWLFDPRPRVELMANTAPCFTVITLYSHQRNAADSWGGSKWFSAMSIHFCQPKHLHKLYLGCSEGRNEGIWLC